MQIIKQSLNFYERLRGGKPFSRTFKFNSRTSSPNVLTVRSSGT